MTAEGITAAAAAFAFSFVLTGLVAGAAFAIAAGGWLIALGAAIIVGVLAVIFLIMATALS